MRERHIVVAITGASGAIYGVRLCRELLGAGVRLSLLVSSAGRQVLREECGLDWRGDEEAMAAELREYFRAAPENLAYYGENNLLAPIASGSSAPDAMAVVPCSMGTLARIAAGSSGNLLERCADVMLKERRTLLLVPRETPVNVIHLENMLRLARLGVRMVPAMPAFYHHPRSIDDLVGFIVGKVLDQLGIENDLFARWREET
ncbi:MAG: UbiX family flavin prenyltransferase [Geobacteraceae bacterium]|nr:UbiX family flavin prenyltransferase [Geobacteraceae bacterium]